MSDGVLASPHPNPKVHACHDVAAMLENDAAAMSEPPPPAQFAVRHRSAAAVLEHSWALLDADERAAFAAVCVFRGRFEAPAATAVAGTGPATLAALIAKSLVRREGDGALSMLCEAGRPDAARSVAETLRRFGRFAATFPTARRSVDRAARLWRTAPAPSAVAGGPGAAQRWRSCEPA